MLEYGVTFPYKGQHTVAAAIVRPERKPARTGQRYEAVDRDGLERVKEECVCVRPANLRFSFDVGRLYTCAGCRHLHITGGEQVFEIGDVQHRIRRCRCADTARAVHVLSRIGGNHHIGMRWCRYSNYRQTCECCSGGNHCPRPCTMLT